MNTQKTPSKQGRKNGTSESWPFKLNKALIAVGVIAFGLIVTDRLLEAFRADDAPVTASAGGVIDNGTQETSQNVRSEASKVRPNESESLVELQNLMGTRVVFVSAMEPGYLVTQDERRFAVGDVVADATTLAGITTHQVILEKSGGLKIFNLPEPVVQ